MIRESPKWWLREWFPILEHWPACALLSLPSLGASVPQQKWQITAGRAARGSPGPHPVPSLLQDPWGPTASRLPVLQAAGSARAAGLLSLAKPSFPKPLLPRLLHLLSCYFLSPRLIPTFHVICCPEKHFWMVLRPLGSSLSQAIAFPFLQFLFISEAVNSAFSFFFFSSF